MLKCLKVSLWAINLRRFVRWGRLRRIEHSAYYKQTHRAQIKYPFAQIRWMKVVHKDKADRGLFIVKDAKWIHIIMKEKSKNRLIRAIRQALASWKLQAWTQVSDGYKASRQLCRQYELGSEEEPKVKNSWAEKCKRCRQVSFKIHKWGVYYIKNFTNLDTTRRMLLYNIYEML